MAVFGGLARHNLFRFSFLKKNKLLLSFWPEEVWKKFIKDFLKGISEMLSDALVMITKNIRSNHWCMCYVYVTHRQGLGLVLGVCSLSPIQYSHKLVFHVYGSPLVWEDKRCLCPCSSPKAEDYQEKKSGDVLDSLTARLAPQTIELHDDCIATVKDLGVYGEKEIKNLLRERKASLRC